MARSSLQGARVLIVDDDPASVRLLRATLADEGCLLDSADTGKAALKSIERDRPHLVLLDLILPDTNGLDLIRTLRADPATRDIVIVVVTGHNGHATEAAALQAGCSAYVRKPLDPITLPQLLASTLEL